MATTVGLIKGATEVVLGIGEVSIDNFTFKLFYKWSVSLFITGSVVVVSSQFFGDPIACETVPFKIFSLILQKKPTLFCRLMTLWMRWLSMRTVGCTLLLTFLLISRYSFFLAIIF